MNTTIKIVALVGSLRRKSITKTLLETARQEAPANMEITVFLLNDIPLYNNDVEVEEGFPEPVIALREAIKQADGVVFGTPEYNGSLTGVLKNAIDWASRGGLLAKKPVVTMGGSSGALGATKAQEHLRQICLHLGMYLLPRPTIAVPKLPEKIDDGTITCEVTRKLIAQQMDTFCDWVLHFKK